MLLVGRKLESGAPDAASHASQRPGLSEGLCATCACARDCTHRRRNPHPVHFCEEFTPDESGRAASAPPAPKVYRAAAPMAAAETGPRSRGLCVNCRHRDTCGLPGHKDGVWHCEEYE